MRVHKMLVPFFVLCVLLSGCQQDADIFEPQATEEYSAGIFSREKIGEELGTAYVIALDQSNSMLSVVQERNSAAQALINSLPGNSQATVFFFNTQCEETFHDLLPMASVDMRKKLIDEVNSHNTTTGGTDLGEMMGTALALLKDQDENLFEHLVVFVVTDGRSDGANGLAERRDSEFFRLCEENRDRVDTYVVYISTEEVPDSLSNGLKTEPVTLGNAEATPIDECRSQLTVWQKEEGGKILSIPDIGQLEAALLNFLYSDADAIFNRSITQNTTVSFPVYPLCAQELTIALTNHVPVRGTLSALKANGSGADLLENVVMDADASAITLSSEEGLEAGVYTMEIVTDEPFSLVISCKYRYQVQYSFRGVDTPGELPADVPLTLHMRLLKPDDSPIKDADSIALSARMYINGESCSVQNGEEIRLPQTDAKGGLELCPIVSYGGVEEELPGFWHLRPADTPPILTEKSFWLWSLSPNPNRILVCSAQDIVQDRETLIQDLLFSTQSDSAVIELADDGSIYLTAWGETSLTPWRKQILLVNVEDGAGQMDSARWEVTIVWTIPFIFGVAVLVILIPVAVFLRKKKKRQQREQLAKLRQAQLTAAQLQKAYAEETTLDEGPIQAGLRWKIEMNGEIYIGGLGLSDETGQRRKGCDLRKVQTYVLSDKKLTPCPNPLPFGLWKYSRTHGWTELILENTPDTVIGCGDTRLTRTIISREKGGNNLCAYGVNSSLPFREITLELPDMDIRAVFQLEYYTNNIPFYN